MPRATTPEAETERRRKISERLTGRTLSDETKRRMSESAIFRSWETRSRVVRTPNVEDLLARVED